LQSLQEAGLLIGGTLISGFSKYRNYLLACRDLAAIISEYSLCACPSHARYRTKW
jgi:hypothetical protein